MYTYIYSIKIYIISIIYIINTTFKLIQFKILIHFIYIYLYTPLNNPQIILQITKNFKISIYIHYINPSNLIYLIIYIHYFSISKII